MRWKALLLAAMLLATGLAGCISDGSSGQDDEDGTQPQSVNASFEGNDSATNRSSNATYLKNDDYNQTHVHDYWPGDTTERVLMDETVSTNTMFSVFYTAFSPFFQDPKTGVGVVWFSLPNGSFVPEGTGKLTVEVDATGALKNGQQAFSYQPANSATYTKMDPQGAQATWEVQLTPEMADLPHSKSTRWDFILEAEGPGSVLDGDINVKITAHKTHEIEAWPEHPDFWENGSLTKLHLANINGTFDELSTFATDFLTDEEGQQAIHLPEGTIVPPETKVLLVKLWYARNGDAKNHANADVTLRVKEGSSSSWYAWQGDNRVRSEGGYKMFAIPVGGDSWDSPYAEESNWAFRIYAPTGMRNPTDDSTMIYMGIGEAGAGNYTIDATAYRVIPPWLSSLMDENGVGDDDRAAIEAASSSLGAS